MILIKKIKEKQNYHDKKNVDWFINYLFMFKIVNLLIIYDISSFI